MRARFVCVVSAVAVVALGCGDSSGGTASLTASPPTTAAGSASPSGPAAPPTGATATSAAPATTRPVPAPSPPPTAAPRQATVIVLVRGAGFCTHIPTVPSPQCDPKPLAGAEVQLLTPGGVTVARGTTGGDGTVSFALAPGAYVVEALAFAGFDERARPASVDARPGETSRVVVTHNTGYQ